MDGVEWLGKPVRMKFGTGNVLGSGNVIAFCGAPMVCVELETGERVWWRADMCEIASGEGQVRPRNDENIEKENK